MCLLLLNRNIFPNSNMRPLRKTNVLRSESHKKNCENVDSTNKQSTNDNYCKVQRLRIIQEKKVKKITPTPFFLFDEN